MSRPESSHDEVHEQAIRPNGWQIAGAIYGGTLGVMLGKVFGVSILRLVTNYTAFYPSTGAVVVAMVAGALVLGILNALVFSRLARKLSRVQRWTAGRGMAVSGAVVGILCMLSAAFAGYRMIQWYIPLTFVILGAVLVAMLTRCASR